MPISFGKKINIILILVIFIYIALTSFFVFNIMKERTMNMQQQLSIQYTEQQYKNAQLYLQSLEATTKLALNHHDLFEVLKNQKYDDTFPLLLDGLRASNLDISSIIVYGLNNTIYSTSNISGFKPYDQLSQDIYFSSFIASDEQFAWSIQNPNKLVTIPYDPRNGLMYMEKILDESGQYIGLMILETKVSRFYEFFKSVDPTISSSSKVALLFNEGNELMYGDGLNIEASDIKNQLSSQQTLDDKFYTYETKKGTFLIYIMYRSNDKIVISINTDQWEKQLNVLKFTLLLVNLIIAAIFIFIILQLTRSIYNPIHQLHQQMDDITKEL